MGDTKTDLDRFHRFAEEQLARDKTNVSLEQLLRL